MRTWPFSHKESQDIEPQRCIFRIQRIPALKYTSVIDVRFSFCVTCLGTFVRVGSQVFKSVIVAIVYVDDPPRITKEMCKASNSPPLTVLCTGTNAFNSQ